jgi:hypothetical protein
LRIVLVHPFKRPPWSCRCLRNLPLQIARRQTSQRDVQLFLVKGGTSMKTIAIVSLLTAMLGGCAIVPLGYGRYDGYYRGQGYYRGDGYYRGNGYYGGDRYYRGDGYRGYGYRDRGG